jgi:RNA polymerase sigma-70 factor (ECF subfamily)
VGPAAQRRLLTGLLAAARQGDVAALTAMLAADVTVWSDGGGRVKAAPRPVHGAAKVARFLAGVYAPDATLDARPIEVNGGPAVVVRSATMFHVVAALAAHEDGVSGIYLISNPDKLRLVPGARR